ncbi:MAG: hypothetical protein JO066_01200 [Verrucomicrobia bacterium]|nr:hypothetical protein [Verrucomicrobiota bacterium]
MVIELVERQNHFENLVHHPILMSGRSVALNPLVYRLAYNSDIVAFKMGRRRGAYLGFSALLARVRIDSDMALRSRLEKQPTDLWRCHHYMRDGTPEKWRKESQWLTMEEQ